MATHGARYFLTINHLRGNIMSLHFNGTYKGDSLHGIVQIHNEDYYNVRVMSFDKKTGQPYESYERLVPRCGYKPRQAVRAVINRPFDF